MEEIAQIGQKRARAKLPGRLISREFFQDSPEFVSPRLLGKLLVARTRRGSVLAGRIVEVEAYLGPHNDRRRGMRICIRSTGSIFARTSAASARDWGQAFCCGRWSQ
jgi:3-methyladenine DNA glycosylase Mpg